jgi:sugar-specific transcriptional regulator TrmB
MQFQRIIEGLGFSSKEVKVYLAALALGESHISDIAQKVKLSRSSAQIIMDRLHKEGLMNFYVMHRYKYWVAENPERLLERLKERENELETIIPRLKELKRDQTGRPSVKIFKGAEEIKLIHDDIISTKQAARAIISWDEWLELLGYDYMKDFRERRAKHFLMLELIVPKTVHSTKLKSKDALEYRRTRFLPPEVHIATSNFIYGNKVAIVSLNRKEPTGIVIEDPDVAAMMSSFFTLLWDQSSE